MKVEVSVEREFVLISVDGFQLDVYKELSAESVEGATKKSVWLSSVAYELRRRLQKITEIEKKSYMAFWRDWAERWLKNREATVSLEKIDAVVARMFGDISVTEKVLYTYDICNTMRPLKARRYETWKEFLNDTSVDQKIRNTCLDMYRLEIEENKSYDRIIEMEIRLQAMVSTIMVAADGYKMREMKTPSSLRF
jgi:cell division protein FtsL